MTPLQRAHTIGLEIATSPVYRDYMRRSRHARYVPLTAPEDVLGEQGGVAGDLLGQVLDGGGEAFAFASERGHQLDRASLVSIAEKVYRAAPYLWLSDVRTVARDQSVPRHSFVPEAVDDTMWWTYDVDLMVMPGVAGIGTLVVRHPDAVEVIDLARRNSRTVIYAVTHLRRGDVYPDDCVNRLDEQVKGGFLALLSFLNSPYIPKKSRLLDAQLRRTFERAGKHADIGRTVHFIDLRSPDPVGNDGGGDSSVEYRHRWIVRGHHRAQWYPSLKGHKVIWVAPYIKGPEGAPMLLPAYRVAR